MNDAIQIVLVIHGRAAIPLVLMALPDQDLVEQRTPQPRYLHPRPGLRALALLITAQAHLAAAGGAPDPDRRGCAGWILGNDPAARQLGDRDLHRDRVDVDPALERVDRCRGRHRREMQSLEGTQIGQVEDRSEVGEEAVVALTGKHLHPAAQRMDGRLGHWRVVRCRMRTDVAWRRREVAADDHRLGIVAPPLADRRPRLARPMHLGDGVELAPIEMRVIQRRDRTVVVQKRILVTDPRLEPETRR